MKTEQEITDELWNIAGRLETFQQSPRLTMFNEGEVYQREINILKWILDEGK